MACMKLKKLEAYLQDVEDFDEPKIALEQYITPPHIASCMLYNIQTQFADISDKFVADLGSGSGMLSIGAALLNSCFVIGFELDIDALDVLKRNVHDMELSNVDYVQANVLQLKSWENVFDTVITNPPFGTKNNAGMDVAFLETAIKLSKNAVYSLHKSTTRDFIHKKSKEWNVQANVVAELRYNLDASYRFHKNKSRDIEVDFWRFSVTNKQI